MNALNFLAAVFLVSPLALAQFEVPVCDPLQLGAKADGVTKDTLALQAAIDQCAASPGGGIVELAPGTYLTAPLTLKSNITLQVDFGATLLASPDITDWKNSKGSLVNFITASSAHDIGITGAGTIDGSGAPWWQLVKDAVAAGKTEPPRPRLITFSACQRIRIEGINLRNSPSFHVVPSASENVVITGVTITAPADSPNTDGIDPSASRNVRISKCTIDVGDDNIAVKSGSDDPNHPGAAAENIIVTDCTFLHGHGMSIGSETNGGVRNVQVQRCTFKDTQNGLRIKSYRGMGGEVSRISYSDITMTNVSPAIVITGYYPKIPVTDDPQPLGARTPRYHDIKITRMTAQGGKVGGQIIGLPEAPIRGLVLDQVSIEAGSGIEIRNTSLSTRGVSIAPAKGPVWIDEGHVTTQDFTDSLTADVIVAADGTGQFTSVQAAIDSIASGGATVIGVRRGVYWERVTIPADKASITLQGEDEYGTVIVNDLGAATIGSTGATGTFNVSASDFTASQLTIENAFSFGSQAVAAYLTGDRQVFRNVRFVGWQDTLYANGAGSRQYFKDCYIEGHVDFIFGNAAAVFDGCEIHSKGAGYITAQSKAAPEQFSGYLFWNTNLTGANTGAGVYLGRPWRAYSQVVFLNCTLGSHIRPEGWSNWTGTDYYLTAWYGEYQSQGPGGDSSNRVPWAHILTDDQALAFDPKAFLAGSDGWNPFDQ